MASHAFNCRLGDRINKKLSKYQNVESYLKNSLGISLAAIPIGFDRWSGMYDSLLGSIDQNLPDILIIGLFDFYFLF